MIHLTIKGGAETAALALNARGIASGFLHASHSDFGQVLTHCEAADADLKKVVAWYCEPDEAPFPDGTLLLYTFCTARRRPSAGDLPRPSVGAQSDLPSLSNGELSHD